MFTNDVQLDKTNAELIRQYKNRIENVFGITISCFCGHEHDPKNEDNIEKGGVSKVRLSSQSSQESLDKAKVSTGMSYSHT